MSSPESIPITMQLSELVCDNYETLDYSLRGIYESKQTLEDENLLDPNVHSLTVYNTVQDVTAAHTLYNSDGAAQKAAFEAFWLAVQITSVLPHKPMFNPGNYFKLPPEELYKQMAEDTLCYLKDKPYISTLIDEYVDIIDPSGVHTVMIESFAAVTIMLIEQSRCDQPDTHVDMELEKEFAQLLFYVDTPFQN